MNRTVSLQVGTYKFGKRFHHLLFPLSYACHESTRLDSNQEPYPSQGLGMYASQVWVRPRRSGQDSNLQGPEPLSGRLPLRGRSICGRHPSTVWAAYAVRQA
jgi:hypothetical protein